MTLTIQVPPEIEAGLLAQAEAEGLDVPRYVEKLVRGHVMLAHMDKSLPAAELSAEERLLHFNDWLNSHVGNTVVLPDEAMERESIYGDHSV